MRVLLSFVISVVFAVSAPSVMAGACSSCKIMSIGSGPNYDRLCPAGTCTFIRVDAEGGNFSRPSCSSSPDWRTKDWHFVLDTSTASSKNSLSQLLVAFSTQKLITIGGAGSCSLVTSDNVENFDYIYFSW